MKAKISHFFGIFFLLFIVFFPLDFLGNFQKKITHFLFGGLTEIISSSVFNKAHIRIDFSSDSLSMFILAGILFIISLIISILLKQRSGDISVESINTNSDKAPKERHLGFPEIVKQIIIIYLAIVLFKYGIDKIFKSQFYLPEPNILYSRFGDLNKDILFWSTMGASRLYSVLTGFVEVFVAVLLMFRKTRIVGLLLSSIIFINIIFINLGFDISVKLFSLMLLLMSIFCMKDDLVKLYRFLLLKKPEQLTEPNSEKNKPALIFIKTFVLGMAFVQIILPYFISKNFNDDNAKRPTLHGAYKVLDEKSELKYLFFHRRNYLILMNKNDEVIDLKYQKTSDSSKIILEDFRGNKEVAVFHFRNSDSVLTFISRNLNLEAKQQNWRNMKAVKPLLHFSVENLDK